jgi:hypothetical protein
MWYAAAFVGGLVFLNRFLRRRDQEGVWSREGHGTPEDREPGVEY